METHYFSDVSMTQQVPTKSHRVNAKLHDIQPPDLSNLKEKICKIASSAETFQLSTCLTICQTEKLQQLVNMGLKSF